MMLGKRSSGRPASARHPMRRTTSMTEFAPPDVLADVAEEEEEEDEESELQLMPVHAKAAEDSYGWAVGGAAAAVIRADWLASYHARAAPALRRNSADFSAAEMTAAFLRACGLCNRRLDPGGDTFMYRGDTAFCSLECREQRITIEWKEKCAALATTPAADPVAPAGAGPDKSAAGGTLAAA